VRAFLGIQSDYTRKTKEVETHEVELTRLGTNPKAIDVIDHDRLRSFPVQHMATKGRPLRFIPNQLYHK
jgi:hypothetical protein